MTRRTQVLRVWFANMFPYQGERPSYGVVLRNIVKRSAWPVLVIGVAVQAVGALTWPDHGAAFPWGSSLLLLSGGAVAVVLSLAAFEWVFYRRYYVKGLSRPLARHTQIGLVVVFSVLAVPVATQPAADDGMEWNYVIDQACRQASPVPDKFVGPPHESDIERWADQQARDCAHAQMQRQLAIIAACAVVGSAGGYAAAGCAAVLLY